MIPGSIKGNGSAGFGEGLRRVRIAARRYLWLWIVYQTLKGLTTTVVIWAPLLYVWLR